MKIFAHDLETFLITPGRHAPRAVSLAWDYGSGPQLLHCILERARYRAVIEEGLEADFIVGANVAYDLAVTVREFPDLLPKVWKAYDEERVWDIEHTEKLCDLHDGKLWWHWDPGHINQKTKQRGAMVKVSYSLAAIVFRRFGVVLDKDTWRLLYGTLADVPCEKWPQGARDYALLDASITYRVWAAQAAEPFSKLVDLGRQAKAAWWLHLMVARGFRVDPEQVEKLATSIWTEREHVAARLKDAGLIRPNGVKDTKAAEARMITVCKAKGLELQYTPKLKIKLTKDLAADTKDPVLKDYARFASLTSMWKGSIVTLRAAARARMPIQSRFEVLQDTGRTSCSGSAKAKKGRNPFEMSFALQLQNVRRGILDEDGEEQEGVRECFVPRDGFVLCSADYSQLELCTWSQCCIDLDCGSALADALNGGTDVHCLLGGLLVGRTYDEVYANRKKEKWAKDARQMAKCGNFGLPGGLGEGGLQRFAKTSYNVILDPSQARMLKARWHEMWPESHKYFRFVRNCVGPAGEGAITQLRSWRRRGGCSFTEASNGFFQSLAADLAKEAGHLISKGCYLDQGSPLYGSRILNFVHDEFILEIPEEQMHDAALETGRLMELSGKKWCPDVSPKVEPALMRRWFKEAEARRVDGRLVPWEPKA